MNSEEGGLDIALRSQSMPMKIQENSFDTGTITLKPVEIPGQDSTVPFRQVVGDNLPLFEHIAANLFHNDPDMLSTLIDREVAQAIPLLAHPHHVKLARVSHAFHNEHKAAVLQALQTFFTELREL
jgi:hypothetical protein